MCEGTPLRDGSCTYKCQGTQGLLTKTRKFVLVIRQLVVFTNKFLIMGEELAVAGPNFKAKNAKSQEPSCPILQTIK